MNDERTEGLAGRAGSVLPDNAGFYWWRPSPLHLWHMVHIQDHAEGIRKTPYLVAYDVSFSSFCGRDIKSWKEFFDVGEWVRVAPPNASGSATPKDAR